MNDEDGGDMLNIRIKEILGATTELGLKKVGNDLLGLMGGQSDENR